MPGPEKLSHPSPKSNLPMLQMNKNMSRYESISHVERTILREIVNCYSHTFSQRGMSPKSLQRKDILIYTYLMVFFEGSDITVRS